MISRAVSAVLMLMSACTSVAGSSLQPDSPRRKALYTFGDSFTYTGAAYIDGNGPTAVAYPAKKLSIPFT
jgi:hypothetical protein